MRVGYNSAIVTRFVTVPTLMRTSGGSPDTELIAAFLSGRPEAHAEVRDWAGSVARRRRWAFDDAEAAVQEILYRLLRILRENKFRGASSFSTFVISVARYTCLELHRTELARRSVALENGPAEPRAADPEPAGEREDRIRLLRYILQKMSDECRRLWNWVYVDGLSSSAVGERLGIAPGTARVRVHRCLEQARRFRQEFEEGPAW